MPSPSYAQYVLSRCPDVCPDVRVNIGFSSFCTNTERIAMKFRGGNHCHQQMSWLHLSRNCTRDKGAGYDRKFESTSDRCCRVANDFTHCARVHYTHAAAEASYDGATVLLAVDDQKNTTLLSLAFRFPPFVSWPIFLSRAPMFFVETLWSYLTVISWLMTHWYLSKWWSRVYASEMLTWILVHERKVVFLPSFV